MATHPYYGPGNVVIDTCETCELVWLDFGELKQIVDAPGKDRGTREQVPRSTSDIRRSSSLPGSARAPQIADGPARPFLARLF